MSCADKAKLFERILEVMTIDELVAFEGLIAKEIRIRKLKSKKDKIENDYESDFMGELKKII